MKGAEYIFMWLLICLASLIIIKTFFEKKEYNSPVKIDRRYYISPRDYQIECDLDSVYVYDNLKLVGVISYDSSKFIQIILRDNK